MSETEVLPTDTDDAGETVEVSRAEFEALADRVAELEQRPHIEGDVTDIKSLIVVDGGGNEVPLGRIITSKLSPSSDTILEIEEAIEKLLRENIDPIDLAGSYSPTYPIEEWVAKAIDDARRGDLSENRYRAAHVFRAFGGRAKAWNGVLRLDSADVKQILIEKDLVSNPNPNTVRRTMEFVARGTSSKPKSDRDPWDSDNLITIEDGEKRVRLVTEQPDWNEFIQSIEEATSQNDSDITLS